MPSDHIQGGFRKNTSGKRLSTMIMNDYLDLHRRASEGAFVVWIAIIVPAELFSGFENVVYGVPESHAALCAGKGAGPVLCEKAEGFGYSTDLCSYARIDIGTAFDGGKDSPTFGLPRPDLIISNNNNCSLLVKWFDVYHRAWGVPHLVLDIPFCYENQKDRDFRYIMDQFGTLISTIEEMSGQRFDLDKARESVRLSSEAMKEWKRFLGFAAHRPSGITAFDSFVQMAPILTSRGTQRLVDHYRLLADETEEQVKNGISRSLTRSTGSCGTTSRPGTSSERCPAGWPAWAPTSPRPATPTASGHSRESTTRTNSTGMIPLPGSRGCRTSRCARTA